MADEPPRAPRLVAVAPHGRGNHNFGLALYNGGALHIDAGKPTPAGITATVANLREIAPTWYFNVPKGYEALLPHLRATRRSAALLQPGQDAVRRRSRPDPAGLGGTDNRLAAGNLRGGAHTLWRRGLGSTETAPFALVCNWEQEHSDNCGLPAPGLELKLAPLEDKLEARMRALRDARLLAGAGAHRRRL